MIFILLTRRRATFFESTGTLLNFFSYPRCGSHNTKMSSDYMVEVHRDYQQDSYHETEKLLFQCDFYDASSYSVLSERVVRLE